MIPSKPSLFPFEICYTRENLQKESRCAKVKIEIWSDYVCPFCYIGKKELERALKEAGLKNQVDVQMKAYELDPTSSTTEAPFVKHSLMQKKGLSEAQVENMFNGVTARAKEVGLDYDFSKMTNANTKKAHQLAKFAEEKGKAHEVSEALLKAHFIEYQSLNDEKVLLDIAEEAGLSRESAKKALNSKEYIAAVNTDIEEAEKIGIQGVPFFVIEHKYGISGAQPQEVFQETLKKVADELGIQPSLQIIGEDSNGICTDDRCMF